MNARQLENLGVLPGSMAEQFEQFEQADMAEQWPTWSLASIQKS